MHDITKRNNVKVIGSGPNTLMLGHGFGCDQNMWRLLIPHLKQEYSLVLFDYVGSGNSFKQSFEMERYSKLDGYAQDIVDIIDHLELTNIHFIGHSVSAMIGLLAEIRRPDCFQSQTMICPSPCFLNKAPDYIGGFEEQDLEELLGLMDKNYLGWANYLSPLVVGTGNAPELINELSDSFCSTDPVMAKQFARATFFSDCRHILNQTNSKALILQSSIDNLVDVSIGKYIISKMKQARLEIIDAEGHCLHMTHPQLISPIISQFIGV